MHIRDVAVLSKGRNELDEVAFDYRRSDGTWQRLSREVVKRKQAAAVLPIDPRRGTVILIRQFRLPVFVAGYREPLIEIVAGALDGDTPENCARREAMEEAGVEVHDLKQVFHCFTSPGAMTERMHLFTATYGARTAKGGGLHEEGEDIEVLELPLSEALAMMERGEIVDAKTVLMLQYLALKGL